MSLADEWASAKPDLKSEWDQSSPAASKKAKAAPVFGSTPPGAKPEQPTGFGANLVGGMFEPAMAMTSGMLAGPISNVAGLAAGAREMFPGAPGGDPEAFRQDVQRSLTYEPRTAAGKAITQYNPLSLFGKGVDIAGGAAEKGIGKIPVPPAAEPYREAAGKGIHEAINQLPGVAGAMYGGKLAEKIPGKQAELDIQKGENVPLDAIRKSAQDAGLVTPPEGFTFSGLAGADKVSRWISGANKPEFTRLVKQDLGIPKGVALTPEELKPIREEFGNKKMEIVRAGYGKPETVTPPPVTKTSSILSERGKPIETTIHPPPYERTPGIKDTGVIDAKLSGPLADMQQLHDSAPKTFRSLEEPIAIIKEHIGIPEHNPRTVMATVTQLRREASKEINAPYDSGKNQSGLVKRAIADAYEDMVEDNLRKNGREELAKQFKDLRVKTAKTYDVEASLDPAGNVDARKLYLLSKKRPFTDNLKLIADYAGTFPEGARKVGAEQALSFWDFAWITGAMTMKHPLSAAADVAARIGIPFAAKKGLLQSRMPSYQASQLPPQIARILGIGTTAGAEQIAPPPQQ